MLISQQKRFIVTLTPLHQWLRKNKAKQGESSSLHFNLREKRFNHDVNLQYVQKELRPL